MQVSTSQTYNPNCGFRKKLNIKPITRGATIIGIKVKEVNSLRNFGMLFKIKARAIPMMTSRVTEQAIKINVFAMEFINSASWNILI